ARPAAPSWACASPRPAWTAPGPGRRPRSRFRVKDPRACDEVAELRPAAAAQGRGQLGDVDAGGTDVHAEALGDDGVGVALGEELGDGALAGVTPLTLRRSAVLRYIGGASRQK